MRILVKEVNWLGDLVMTLPALRALRRAFPEARLEVLVKGELASFFDGFRWLDDVIPYALSPGAAGLADRWRLVRSLRARRFDLAVILPRSFDAALWPALARVPRRVGVRSDGRRFLLTRSSPRPRRDGRHQVHAYLDMLRDTLDVEGSADDVAVSVAEAHRQSAGDWLRRGRRADGPLVAVAAAAAYGPAKEWPAESFAALIDRLAEDFGAECVLVGAANERRRCEEIAAASESGALVAAGEMNLGGTVALLAACDGFVGNDSGAMHVAAALGLPTVAIFGSTDPSRTGPLGPRTRVLRHPIECSPCFDRTCRFGHYECLRRVAVDEVCAALRDLAEPD